jgi:S-formylglutathione hydrolase FrmB
MPEGGLAGWYRDWYGHTDGFFAPAWETFHVDQLIPWIDGRFNTIEDRSGRAVAGLSMGGFGALQYAGRHPDLFGAVGAFSGGTDLRSSAAREIIPASMWQAGAAVGLTGIADGRFRVNLYEHGSISGDAAKQLVYRMTTLFGPPTLVDEPAEPDGRIEDWPTVNPLSLLRSTPNPYAGYGTRFGLYAGGCDTQRPGSTVTTSDGTTNSGGCAYPDEPAGTEAELALMNRSFDAALSAAGINHRYCTGTGTHDWPYWRADLRDFLGYVYGPASLSPDCNNA